MGDVWRGIFDVHQGILDVWRGIFDVAWGIAEVE
jgi:hypothetical protein